MQHLKSGSHLQNGKYRIEKVLGQGGFGITYLAAQELLDRKVCIKEFFFKEYCEREGDSGHISLGTQSSHEIVERFMAKFLKEARTISRFEHSNIIRIHDIFMENNTAYYVMEYIDGESLADKINNNGQLSETDSLDYVRQVASALDFLHQRSINHLDVKPANIMVRSSDNRAILIDFGLSKQYDDQGGQTSTTPVGVSHGYAPMEQYKQGGVSTFSPQTDIYALGATLYKLVTGNTPPQSLDILDTGLPSLPSFVSTSVEDAIKKAMQPRKMDRPHSIPEWIASLNGKSEHVSCVSNEKIHDESTELAGPYCESQGNDGSNVQVTKPASKGKKLWVWVLVAMILCVGGAVLKDAMDSNYFVRSSSAGNSVNGHEYVDLGLSVKWAACNVGATSPHQYGSYFSWGETAVKDTYVKENSKTYGKNIGNDISGDGYYDVARAGWGDAWRIPTEIEMAELVNSCTWTEQSINGIMGFKVTGPNGNSIFLPAAGYREGTGLHLCGERCIYWTSAPYDSPDVPSDGLTVMFDWGSDPGVGPTASATVLEYEVYGDFYNSLGHRKRYSALTVRPVI